MSLCLTYEVLPAMSQQVLSQPKMSEDDFFKKIKKIKIIITDAQNSTSPDFIRLYSHSLHRLSFRDFIKESLTKLDEINTSILYE